MASLASNACNASAKMLINHGKEGNLVQYLDKDTILALVNELKKASKPPKKSQKKSTERADAPFNPDRCSARLYSLACHPCGSGNLYKNKKSEGQEFHYGLLNVQCNRNIHANGLCAHHADTTKKSSDNARCHETGELFLGLYNEEKPQNPIRISASGTKHHYVWLEDVDQDIQANQKKAPKKSSRDSKSSTSEEKYEDRNWNDDLNTGDIDSFKLNRLKLYAKHNNLPTHTEENGKKKALSKAQYLEAVKAHIKANQQEQLKVDDQEDDQENDQALNKEDNKPDNKAEQHDDEKLTAEEYTMNTWTTPDGITYDLELGELYDQDSGEKVGDISDTDPKGWVPRKEAIMIHAQNIAKKMADTFEKTL